MIITFYDKDFKALQNNASLVVGKWSIKRRAVDFDDFTATSEAFVEDVNPTYVVMSDDLGKYYYGAFAGIPQLTEDNQTNLQASDLKTFFNSEIVYTNPERDNLVIYLRGVFTTFALQVSRDFAIYFDDDIQDISLTYLKPSGEHKSYNTWEDLILPYLKYYDLFMESSLDLINKKLNFRIRKANKNEVPLRLWEFDIKNFGKQIAPVNSSRGAVLFDGNLEYGTPFYLLEDNSITTNKELINLYPPKHKYYFMEESSSNMTLAEAKNKINFEALKILVEARYSESLEINTKGIAQYEEAYFDTSFNIYVKKGKLYKKLPLGEITDDNTGIRKLKLGYKVDDLVFYL